MNRRGFFKFAALAGAAVTSLTTSACWLTASVFTKIISYVGVGLQAFQSVIDLLSGAGVLNLGLGTAVDGIVALVKAGFADLQTAVNDYNNAPAAQKQTLLEKVSTAMADVEANIQQFWNDLKIPDQKLSSTVEGLLGIILSTLAGFQTSLPAPTPTPAQARKKALAKTIMVSAKTRSTKQFKEDFNTVLEGAGYSQYAVR